MNSSIPTAETDAATVLRHTLADQLKNAEQIRTAPVEAAFRTVPRHLFVPEVTPAEAYRDQSIPVKRLDGRVVSSSSQPAIMAVMLEQLEVRPGQRILEIGAGTGYNAALLAHIVGETGQVVTVDLDEDIVLGARVHLASAGFDRVQVVCGDGSLGYPDAAPYDRIILTVGAWDIAPAWQEQLASRGRLLLPLSVCGPQFAVAFEPAGDHLTSVSIAACSFMRLRGLCAGPDSDFQLGSEPGLSFWTEHTLPTDLELIYAWVVGPYRERSTAVQVTAQEIWESLGLWLALREADYCGLTATGRMAERDLVPDLVHISSQTRYRTTSGLVDKNGLSLFARASDSLATNHQEDAPFDLYVRSFGDDDTAADRLIQQVMAWDAAGRPTSSKLAIRAYPAQRSYVPAVDEFVVSKPWTQLVLRWQ